MKRRDFITLLSGAAVAWPVVVHAQQGERMRRVGMISPLAADDPGCGTQFGGARDSLLSSMALASIRSGVPKPSVNQP
jgi:hypothetical protein